MDDNFTFMKQCLKEFNYPNIHSKDDTEIAGIFSTSNRVHLVTWMFNKLDEEYAPFLVDCTKEDLANLIHQNGFCLESQKISFFNGDLPVHEQLNILWKMFKFIKHKSDFVKKQHPEAIKTVSNEDLEQFLNKDVNLFSVYGPKKKLTPKERNAKLEEYKIEIEKLKNVIASRKPDDTNEAVLLSDEEKDRLQSTVGKLEKIVQVLNKYILNMAGVKTEELKQFQLNPEAGTTLKKLNIDLQKLLEYIDNIDVITKYEKNPDKLHFDSIDGINRLLKEVAELPIHK